MMEENEYIPMPLVTETSSMNMSQSDIYSRLLVDRIILLQSSVNSISATAIQAQLLYLDSVSNDPIKLLINSGGGSVTDGLGIIDVMNLIKAPVHTTCIGMAASMAAVILACGEKGNRKALTNSRIMIHQASGYVDGSTTDIKISYELQQDLENTIFDILAKQTGNSFKKIKQDCDRDKWFKSEDAVKYGLIDSISNS
jgi:ATP-dependent Clp protease protease subunit